MRNTRILAACCHVPDASSGLEKLDRNRRMIGECLERAAAFRPDFVVFPEIAVHLGVCRTNEALPYAETVPGPTTELVAAHARALGSYVLLPLFERDGDLMYNSVVLLGRDGAVLGTYRKYHATGYEIEEGVQPGDTVPVWQTDRGRVGCAVCFDLKFPEVGLALSRAKAQVVFWPSMFEGGRRLLSWAMDYGCYMVKCTAGSGGVVDPAGALVATEGPPIPLAECGAVLRWCFAEVNTDRKSYHLDFNQNKLPDLINRYGGGVSILLNRPEGTFTLASNLPDRTVEQIEVEFDLEDLRDYLDRAARIRLSRLR